MSVTKRDYRDFQKVYLEEEGKLRALGKPGDPGVHVSDADEAKAKAALDRLKGTAYGRVLCGQPSLVKLFESLDGGLGDLKQCMLDAGPYSWEEGDPMLAWVEEDVWARVRQFRFYGRMGGVFRAYRDLGLSLNTRTAEALIRGLHTQARDLAEKLDVYLLNQVVSAFQPLEMIERLRALRDELEWLQEASLAAPRTKPNPLQDGWTIVRRQFIASVCLVCFELFGHLTPSALHKFLLMKSENAEALGQVAWPYMEPWRPERVREQPLDGAEELSAQQASPRQRYGLNHEWDARTGQMRLVVRPLSADGALPGRHYDLITQEMADRERVLRRAIGDELERARDLAKGLGWVTKDVIAYFAEHRDSHV